MENNLLILLDKNALARHGETDIPLKGYSEQGYRIRIVRSFLSTLAHLRRGPQKGKTGTLLKEMKLVQIEVSIRSPIGLHPVAGHPLQSGNS
jgi:hypothetical protein